MTPKSARDSDKIFALDWRGLAQKGVLGDVLRLFSLRYAWLKDGDQRAYEEIARARRAADPNIREAAELLFSAMTRDKQPSASLTEAPKGEPRTK